MAKLRYKLHWNSNPLFYELKWAIWDWKLKTPIAYFENRKLARLICNQLNDFDKRNR